MHWEMDLVRFFSVQKEKKAQEVPKELVNFLHYVEHSNDTYVAQIQDKKIEKLHKKIEQSKKSRAWEERYMTFGQMLDNAKKEGEKRGEKRGQRRGKRRGEKQGIKRLLELMNRMTQAGETEAISRLHQDEAFLQEMFRKYKV